MLILIRNEFVKTFMRGKTWVVLVLLIGFCGVLTYSTYNDYKIYKNTSSPDYQIEWLKRSVEDIQGYIKDVENDKNIDEPEKTQQIESYKTDIKGLEENIKSEEKRKKDIENGVEINYIPDLKEQLETNKNQIKEIEKGNEEAYNLSELKLQAEELEYRIDNNINEPVYIEKFNGYEVLKDIIENIGMLLLPIGIMIFFSDMVSGEYTPATLKFLLVQPVSRRKVLISKIITSAIIGVFLIILIEVLYFVGVGIFTGFQGGTSPIAFGAEYVKEIAKDGTEQLNLVENSASIISLSSFLFKALGLQILFIIATTMFTVMVSTIFKSSMITMAISIVTTVAIFILTEMSAKIKEISHFIFLSFSQITYLISGDLIPYFNNTHFTINTFVIVMIITSIISYIISDLVFTKRDILI